MRRKEIVVLDCGVEVRQEPAGILFTSYDTGREFAFGIRTNEVADMILYLQTYIEAVPKDEVRASSLAGDVSARERTVEEKVAQKGLQGGYLMPPGAATGKGRVVPMASVSVHK